MDGLRVCFLGHQTDEVGGVCMVLGVGARVWSMLFFAVLGFQWSALIVFPSRLRGPVCGEVVQRHVSYIIYP